MLNEKMKLQPDEVYDNLEEIEGVGPKFAEALNKAGIYRHAQLVKYPPRQLSEKLWQEAGIRVSENRIQKDNWLGQSREILRKRAMPDVDETEAAPTDILNDHDPQNQHEFTVFFDVLTGEDGQRIWQTRVYDDKSGEEDDLPGVDPALWTNWIMERVRLPVNLIDAQAEAAAQGGEAPPVQIDITSLQVIPTEPDPETYEKKLQTRISFGFSGLRATEFVTEQPRFRVEIHGINQENQAAALFASGEGRLPPGQESVHCDLAFPLPELGLYDLYAVVLVLPPHAALSATQRGPTIKIVP